MNIYATELPNFVRKYYLLHKLLIFKYWWQNISNMRYILRSGTQKGQRSCPQSMRDSACVHSSNTGLHHSSSGQPTVLILPQSTTRFGGSCRSVCTAARFVTSTSWSRAWSKSGKISTRWSSMKRSGSGVHVFKLAFEHTVDILNTEFRCADVLPFARTHTWLDSQSRLCLYWTLTHLRDLTKLAVAVADVDQFYWKLWLVCYLTCQCWRRISLKSDVVCQSYGNVYRVTVFRGHGV